MGNIGGGTFYQGAALASQITAASIVFAPGSIVWNGS
jgi:hypothetical protein